MMFRHLGWTEAADLAVKGLLSVIAYKRMTLPVRWQTQQKFLTQALKS